MLIEKYSITKSNIHHHFDYVIPAWYSHLTKKIKARVEATHSQNIRFCLQLDTIAEII